MSPKFDVAAILALVATVSAPGFASAQESFAAYSSAMGLLSFRDSPGTQISDYRSSGLAGFAKVNGSVTSGTKRSITASCSRNEHRPFILRATRLFD
jgi:hypothetical protein